MNSPYFREEHDNFRTIVRKFIEKEVVPHSREWEKEERIPRDIWLKMGDKQFLGINYSEQFGGMETGFFSTVVFLEELARCGMGGFTAAVSAHQFMALSYLSRFANKKIKQKYLEAGISGKRIGAVAITEPNNGADVAAISTSAQRHDDHYLLNGAKTFTTNGVYGDFIIVAAKTDADAGAGGISLLIVDSDAEGLSRRKLDKIGWHCSDTAEISFDNVKVPLENIIGEENMGFYYVMECFPLERLVTAITSVSASCYCLEVTLEYLSQRKAFDRSLAQFQNVRHTMADLSTRLEAARQLTYSAAWLYSKGEVALRECSMARLYAGELLRYTADTCLQAFGGYGYTSDFVISRFFRDARAATLVEGSSEVMREVISKIVVDERDFQHQATVGKPREKKSDARSAVEPGPEMLEFMESAFPDAPMAETQLLEPLPAPAAPPAAEAKEQPEEPTVLSGDKQQENPEPVTAELPEAQDAAEDKPEAKEAPPSAPPAAAAVRKPEPAPAADESSDEAESREILARIVEKVVPMDTVSPIPPEIFSESEPTIPVPADAFAAEPKVADQPPAPPEPRLPVSAEILNKPAAPGSNGLKSGAQFDTERTVLATPVPQEPRTSVDPRGRQRSGRRPTPGIPANATRQGIQSVQDIFDGMPHRFRPEKAGAHRTIFHFKLSGDNGGEYTVKISAGRCTVEDGLKGDPRCIVETTDKTYMDIELGKTNPQVAFMMGKVRVSNIPEMTNFTRFFRKLHGT